MERKIFTLISIFSLAGIVGCRGGAKPGTTGGCSTAQAGVEDASALVNSSPVVPAGGFVHIGANACTATFLLKNATETSLTVSAYTAYHCFRENSIGDEAIGLSVHVPTDGTAAAGYMKNLKATDDFFRRRREFLSEVSKLSSAEASAMSKRAMEIPLFADRGIEQAEESENVNSTDAQRRNVCLSAQKSAMKVADSQGVCWSALDSTVRTLEIRSDQIGKATFARLKNLLQQKKQLHDAHLSRSSKISQVFNLWNDRIHGQTGSWRLRNYVEIASFLNKEVCGRYLAADDPNQSICRVRDKMIELAKKYLVEIDNDGKQKSIIDQAQGWGFGLDSPFARPIGSSTDMRRLDDLLAETAANKFYESTNRRISDLREMFPTKDKKILALPKNFSVAANSMVKNSKQGSGIQFALIDSSALLGSASALPSPGVETLGILRMYLSTKGTKIKFGPTDSGAMLTFAGVVPLLMLNTVDDKPTSGGSAILALPEIADDEEGSGTTRGRTGSGNVAQAGKGAGDITVVDSDDALVAARTTACR